MKFKLFLSNIGQYIKLMRVKHYIKNILILIPLFFNKNLLQSDKLKIGIYGFICFSVISSLVYIVNDIADKEKDRNHPQKRNRPIASGKISVKQAMVLMGICVIVVVLLLCFIDCNLGLWILMLYFGINVAYSMKLKKYPILDIVILASCYVIRVYYGGVILDIEISNWLYLVIISGAVFMGLGKRRNELSRQTNTREVLTYYNEAFLDKNMYMSLSLVIVFYSLWTLESNISEAICTVPIILIILMKYSYDIEFASDGDPIEVILNDKLLVGLIILYVVTMFVLLYI